MSLVHLHGREKNLAEFGWTQREAEWIALVCLHSGCFLRSQMCRYLQIDRPAASRLVRSIVDRRFGHEVPLQNHRGSPSLCRISHRQIYRALGAEHIRYRRAVHARLALMRVLGLDFILEHPAYHWLPTEQDKVHYFHSQLDISTHRLPSRVYKGTAGQQQRFFVSKYPIAHDKTTVTFLYIDPRDLTDKPLRSWLSDHRQLFHALRQAGQRIRIIVVASDRKVLTRADRILGRWSKTLPAPHEPSPPTGELDKLTQAYRNGDAKALAEWGGPNAAFKRMNELKRQSPAPREASAPCQIDTWSVWHSTRLAGINFESLDYRRPGGAAGAAGPSPLAPVRGAG